jgi:hypothetical protein
MDDDGEERRSLIHILTLQGELVVTFSSCFANAPKSNLPEAALFISGLQKPL